MIFLEPHSLEDPPVEVKQVGLYVIIIITYTEQNQVPQCVRKVTLKELHISCHNLQFCHTNTVQYRNDSRHSIRKGNFKWKNKKPSGVSSSEFWEGKQKRESDVYY